MGDHADDALNDFIEVWSGPGTHAYRRCRYCGDRNVQWLMTPRGWRLHSFDRQPHTCPQYAARDMDDTP